MYSSGEVIVDVLVVMSAGTSEWGPDADDPRSKSASVWKARFHTNGFNVPARLQSSGYSGASILIRVEQGTDIHPTRALLGEPLFLENWERLGASTRTDDNVRVITITRAGRPYHACFVPVLLATDEPLRIGAQADVRIKPRWGPSYDIDDRWYRLTVELFDPPAGGAR